jgi:hypothetical protein
VVVTLLELRMLFGRYRDFAESVSLIVMSLSDFCGIVGQIHRDTASNMDRPTPKMMKFTVLYSKHKTQKKKLFQNGFLKYYPASRKVCNYYVSE